MEIRNRNYNMIARNFIFFDDIAWDIDLTMAWIRRRSQNGECPAWRMESIICTLIDLKYVVDLDDGFLIEDPATGQFCPYIRWFKDHGVVDQTWQQFNNDDLTVETFPCDDLSMPGEEEPQISDEEETELVIGAEVIRELVEDQRQQALLTEMNEELWEEMYGED